MKYNVVKISLLADSSTGSDEIEIARELVTAIAGEAGCESFDDDGDSCINGYVQEGMLSEDVLNDGLATLPFEGIRTEYRIEPVEDRNWNEQWEKNGFEPIIVDDRCIIHDTLHDIERGSMEEITIDAVQAFGTGTHETTQMIVSYIINGAARGRKVLDCGCGSGILSVAAMKYGAESVLAYDIDSWSSENTAHNAAINGVDGIEVRLGDAHVLDDVEQKFGMVMANINRNILLNDMPSFVRVMDSGADLILSGFYTDDAAILTEKAQSLGLRHKARFEKNGWCCLVFTR